MPEPEVLTAFARMLTDGREWMEHARCRKIDLPPEERVNLFFPYRGGSQKKAKETCRLCPVARQCDAYAEQTRSMYGVWGGKIRKRYPKRVPLEVDPFV